MIVADNKSFLLVVVLAVTSAFSTSSISTIYLSDTDDSTWLAQPGDVTFTVNDIFGAIGQAGELAFGTFDPLTAVLREIFPAGFSAGDSETVNDLGTEPFGFYIENKGAQPNVYYSDSTLNPLGGDAMLAQDMGGNSWTILFEESNLPIIPGDFDLRLTVSNIMPESMPEAPTVLMLSLGLVTLVAVRRLRRGKRSTANPEQ
jgi:hypothetical protein